jgi:magnesium-protoporphyrin O-methyltransferase
MRATLLSWLPQDMRGATLLDAGCGTGALSVAAARRGADVMAVDLSPTLLDLARERLPADLGQGRVRFHAGDMRDAGDGRYTHAVAMDSFIHYPAPEILRLIEAMAARTDRSVLFTFAPKTALLTAMHAVGKLFPRGDRSPAIEPVSEATLRRLIASSAALAGWRIGRTHRVSTGFYISQAMEIIAP